MKSVGGGFLVPELEYIDGRLREIGDMFFWARVESMEVSGVRALVAYIGRSLPEGVLSSIYATLTRDERDIVEVAGITEQENSASYQVEGH